MAKRIAISGKIASGKTTSANILRDKYGYAVRSIATPLKDIAKVMTADAGDLRYIIDEICLHDKLKTEICLGKVINELYPVYGGHDLTFKDDKTRSFLQELGRAFRSVDPNIWVNYLVGRTPTDKSVAIDDMRYKNEYRQLKAAGFITVRVEITSEVQSSRTQQLYGHIDPARLQDDSETELDDAEFDYIIDNNGPMEGLVKQLTIIGAI